ncbi:hypothetical protein FHY05_004372, partial [Sphingomonas sp. BK580]|nr:hypothetical protein [Sphingomonas sp. BK580]
MSGAATVAVAATKSAEAAPQPAGATPTMPVRLTVNGEKRELALDPRTTLLDALR